MNKFDIEISMLKMAPIRVRSGIVSMQLQLARSLGWWAEMLSLEGRSKTQEWKMQMAEKTQGQRAYGSVVRMDVSACGLCLDSWSSFSLVPWLHLIVKQKNHQRQMWALLQNTDKVEIADYKHAFITALCFATYACKTRTIIKLYTVNT